MNYKTPNVYVEEISTLPPSVAGVSTAIPAFIGRSEKADKDGVDLTNKPTRVETLLEYESIFGGPEATEFKVTQEESGLAVEVPDLKYTMHYNLRLYFNNGGGPCYIVSAGGYEESVGKAAFESALAELAKEDEPTLIVLSDAVGLGQVDYYDLCEKALAQCGTNKDRFAVIDVPDGVAVDDFRAGVGQEYLKYGAAYHPWLQTSLNYHYTDDSATVITDKGADGQVGGGDDATQKLADIKSSNTALYSQIKTELAKKRVILPPGGAVAGAYVRTDNERGVWKAPANVGLASVIGPVAKVTDQDQENLNVDATAGKSINAIRGFTGKGTLIWGARTLAGNDNEWRYVPVRRLFIYIEESIQKASAFAVFEPNNAMTWLKVRTMIESFLEDLWRQGALAGSTAEQAFFVNVGLGTSMTERDILEGRMIIEIGAAAVRPAEFIILRFSHKLQEA